MLARLCKKQSEFILVTPAAKWLQRQEKKDSTLQIMYDETTLLIGHEGLMKWHPC